MDNVSARERILEVSRALIAERGFGAVSLADIASKVGISRTTVAYHFHPKERLLAELLQGPRDGLAELLAGPAIGADFMHAYIRFVVEQRDSLGLIFLDPSLLRHPQFGPHLHAGREAVVARLVAGDSSPTARVQGWAIMGAINISALQTTDLDAELVVDTIDALAQTMLTAR